MYKRHCYIDFEFNSSEEPNVNLVSCSLQVDNGPVRNVWLHNEEGNQKKLADYFLKLQEKYVFVAYAAAAECRSFQALGLDPNEFKWIDLYFEHLQLTHTYEKFKYGCYYKDTGIKRHSVPPSYDPRKNIGKDNNEIGRGYVDAVAVHFEEYIDSKHKDDMRELILMNKLEYSKEEREDIMKYCASDIKWLPKLLKSMTEECCKVMAVQPDKMQSIQINRGDFAASLGKMESEGFPFEYDQAMNLRHNFPEAKEMLIEELNKVYPFYLRKKPSRAKGEYIGEFKKDYNQFVKFLENCEHVDIKKWPMTDGKKDDSGKFIPGSQKYKMDSKTLDKFEGITEIKALKKTIQAIDQLKWFQITEKDGKVADFFNNVGSDKKLRAFLGGFGTLSGRNAPKAKTFILAMSKWLRCLIKPAKDEAVVAIDYESQEFIIAAVLSGDRKMRAAYDSGDPYSYFAQQAGAIPKNVENIRWVKSWWDAPEKDQETYRGYSEVRTLFKATVLGLQFGMGVDALAVKLTADCGRVVDVKEAQKLVDMHKRVFSTYWNWLKNHVEYVYQIRKCITLEDGWSLFPNNDNMLSVKNFPVQGTGGVIMRRAVHLAHKRGVRLLAPLHDAIYAVFNTKTQADHPQILSDCMAQAVEDVLGIGVDIRQEIDIHEHDDVWIEDRKYYEMLKQYLEKLPTAEDREQELMETIFKTPEVFCV